MAGLVTIGPKAVADLSPSSLLAKQDVLFESFRAMGRVLVAYSGGTDSAYLAWAAAKVLGQQAIAVTADSASIPESHKRDAADFARDFGIRHLVIPTYEFENPDYVRNDKNRCFHCKDELFRRMADVSAETGIEEIVYGVNTDDLGDYRPGQTAAKIHQVKAPLVEAGLSKAEIRELSRLAGLPTWDRPAAACLSSRLPYGESVTVEKIKKIESGEDALQRLGFRQYRVRYHGELVRLEFGREELPRALDMAMAAEFTRIFKALGFHFVTVDLEGYRQGSLNAVLSDTERQQHQSSH